MGGTPCIYIQVIRTDAYPNFPSGLGKIRIRHDSDYVRITQTYNNMYFTVPSHLSMPFAIIYINELSFNHLPLKSHYFFIEKLILNLFFLKIRENDNDIHVHLR